jgi:HEAT repeat protein
MNPESLLNRVKEGNTLTERELEAVRRALAEGAEHNKYTLVHVLWKAHDPGSKGLILACTDNPDEMVRRIALQALSELLPSDEVFDLALRMTEDGSKYVRMAAATTIGRLGASMSHRTAEAAGFLLRSLEQRQSTDDPEWEYYYEGLLDLIQVLHQKRPSVNRELRVTDIDAEAIRIARSMVSQG